MTETVGGEPSTPAVRKTSRALHHLDTLRNQKREPTEDELLADPILATAEVLKELREYRETNGLTLAELAGAMYWAASKQSRIETGHSALSPVDFKKLLRALVDDPEDRDRLQSLYDAGRTPAWWSEQFRVPQVSSALRRYIGRATTASVITQYATAALPDLLQDQNYAAALRVTARSPAAFIRELQKRVVHKPPHQFYVIDERVMRTPVGSSALMARQLEHLADHAQEAAVDLWALPLDAPHPIAPHRGFTLLSSPYATIKDVLYVRRPTADDLFEEHDAGIVLDCLRVGFDALARAALSPRDSVDFIRERAARMRRNGS